MPDAAVAKEDYAKEIKVEDILKFKDSNEGDKKC